MRRPRRLRQRSRRPVAEPGRLPRRLPPARPSSGRPRPCSGAPYRDGGALPDGFDCSGLVTYVFARNGIAVPRDVRRQAAAGIEIERAAVLPGDLLFFSTTGAGPTHVGIAVGGDRFIHAPKSGAVVRVESLASAYWSAHLVAVRRLPYCGSAAGSGLKIRRFAVWWGQASEPDVCDSRRDWS